MRPTPFASPSSPRLPTKPGGSFVREPAMAINIEVESKPSGRVILRVYCPDTTPATAEHLMNRVQAMHNDVVRDVARAWGIAYDPDVENAD